MSYVLAVDIGTTSSKALLVNPQGQVLASAQQAYSTHYPRAGFAEQTPADILDAVRNIIATASLRHTHQIRAISFSCAMHSLMAVDEQALPLTPLIIWADTRSSEEANELRQGELGKKLHNETGTPVHPMSPLPKLMWLKKHQPEVFSYAARFISIKEWIVFQFTGRWLVDYSIASATGLFNTQNLEWHVEALQLASIDASRLSQLVSPYHQVPILSAYLQQWNLLSNTKIIVGGNDGCLANLGSGAMRNGELALTVGTSGAVRMAVGRYAPDPQQRLFNYRLDEQTFIVGGATNNGLVLLEWYHKFMGQTQTWTVDQFAFEGMKTEAGAAGLVFLPFVFGERSPLYNPDQRGVFIGLAEHHRPHHLMRALMEGICFELRWLMQCVEEVCAPVENILASGGFTRSPAWMQLMADVLNRPLTLRDVNDASALGAAAMGFQSLGVPFRHSNEAHAKVFHPKPENRALYDELFQLFVRSTQALNSDFAILARIQKSNA